VATHFFYEYRRPSPSELPSAASGGEECFRRLETHQFLFGALTSLFSALKPSGIFLLPHGKFILYGGNLRPPGF
jgi:hypothetical protein